MLVFLHEELDGLRSLLTRAQDLVMQNLENAGKKLSLLVEPRLKMALEDYVHKGDAQVWFRG